MSSYRCWSFHVALTYNRDLPLDLQEDAVYLTYRITETGHKLYKLFGFVQFKKTQTISAVANKLPGAVFTSSDIKVCREQFYPLLGGWIVSVGLPDITCKEYSHYIAPIRRPPNPSYKRLVKAAESPLQTKISLVQLAASEAEEPIPSENSITSIFPPKEDEPSSPQTETESQSESESKDPPPSSSKRPDFGLHFFFSYR